VAGDALVAHKARLDNTRIKDGRRKIEDGKSVAGRRLTESVSAKELPGAGVQRVFDGQTISLRSTLVAARQLILFPLDSMGLAVAFRLGGPSIVSTVKSHLLLVKKLWLAVEEVIHHDDVMLAIVIRPRGNVAARDPDRCDARVVKHDAEEGEAAIARRSRHETAEYQPAVAVEVLDQRAGVSVSALYPRSAAIWLVNVCEDCTEAADSCRAGTISTGYEEHSLGDVTAYRREQPGRAERAEDGAVGGIIEQRRQPALGTARGRSLRKAQPRCGKLATARVQEHVERRYRSGRSQNVGVAAIPVDFAATTCQGPWVVCVIGIPESSAERVNGALDGRRIWPGRLKHMGRNKVALCVCSLANWKQRRQQAKDGYDGGTNWQLHRCMLFPASSRRLMIV